jgi:predicted secreted protein with PEFG-CTERM motif
MHNAILVYALLGCLLALSGEAAAQEQTKFQAKTDHGTFLVEITWTPDDIGRANTFDIRFIEPETGRKMEDMRYDISIYNGDMREVQRTDQDSLQQKFSFSETGSHTIRINNIDGLDENVSIPIQVTPEFPSGVLLVLAATIIGVVIFVGRRNSNTLFSQQAN